MANGSKRRELAREVENRKDQILRRKPDTPELEAFRLAAQQVASEQPTLLAAYRADSERI